MTCFTEDPLAPRVHVVAVVALVAAVAPVAPVAVVVVVFAVRPDAAIAAGAPPPGPASRPSARVPPPTAANSAADRRARPETGVLWRTRPGPFISLVAPIGGYLQRHRLRPFPGAGARLGAALSMGAKES